MLLEAIATISALVGGHVMATPKHHLTSLHACSLLHSRAVRAVSIAPSIRHRHREVEVGTNPDRDLLASAHFSAEEVATLGLEG